MRGQPRNVEVASDAASGAGQDHIDAHQMESDGGYDVVHRGANQAIVARATQPHGPYPLRKGTLDACPQSRHLLDLSLPLESFMSRLWAHMQHAADRLRPGTILAQRTGRTGLFGENDLQVLAFWAQARTGLAGWAGRLLRAPINREVSQIKSLAGFGLPAGWDQPIGCPAASEVLSVYRARIHQLLIWLEMGMLHFGLKSSSHITVRDGDQRGVNLNNHVGNKRFAGLSAGFGQMSLVLQPDRRVVPDPSQHLSALQFFPASGTPGRSHAASSCNPSAPMWLATAVRGLSLLGTQSCSTR
jgi:hypothetical protein